MNFDKFHQLVCKIMTFPIMKSLAVPYVIGTVVHIILANIPDPRERPPIHQPLNDFGEKLFLTPYIDKNRIEEARQVAEVHLEDFQNVTSYSGFLTVDKQDNSNIFFWFFPSASNYKEDPVLLWLQGGPGAVGTFGIFVEHGPFRVVDGSVVLRDYSWHKTHSLLYIDQPVGSGFSFTEGNFVTDETQLAEHLYTALAQFFELFPEIRKNEFYVTGESYAGKFVPVIGHAIHQKNPSATNKINLKGLLIGNGLSDPLHQMQHGDLLYQLGLIDSNALIEFHKTEAIAINLIERELYYNATQYWNKIVGDLFSQYTGLPDIYNYINDFNNFPTKWTEYLLKDRVRQAIHVGNQSFTIKNNDVYNALYTDITKSVAPWISELLSHYRILIYNGQLDIKMAYVITENYLQKLNFSAATEYKTASRKIWYVGDRVAGYVRTAGNLTEVLVRNAGHLVPLDQPEFAYDMVTKFISKQPIAGN